MELTFFRLISLTPPLAAIIVFSLPAETGEKVGLGINSMLAMIVFLMAMTENLPPTDRLPLAGEVAQIFLNVCLCLR